MLTVLEDLFLCFTSSELDVCISDIILWQYFFRQYSFNEMLITVKLWVETHMYFNQLFTKQAQLCSFIKRLTLETLRHFMKINLMKMYTANVLTIRTTGTGNCGGPAGKICTIYGKGL